MTTMSRATVIPVDEAVDYLAQLLNLAEVYKQSLAWVVDLDEEECPTCAGTGFEHVRATACVRLARESAQALLRLADELRELVTANPAWFQQTPSGMLRLAESLERGTP